MLMAVTHCDPAAAVELDVDGLFAERADHGIFAANFLASARDILGHEFLRNFRPRAFSTLFYRT